MLSILQNTINTETLRLQTDNLSDLEELLRHLNTGSRSEKNKALAMLAGSRGLTVKSICRHLGISTSTYYDYKRLFSTGRGGKALCQPTAKREKKWEDGALKEKVFKILHRASLPNYGLNRTT